MRHEPLPVLRDGLAQIMQAVCREYHLHHADLVSPKRAPMLIAARKDFIIKAKQAGYSFPVIGRAIRRHHATALYHYHAATNVT